METIKYGYRKADLKLSRYGYKFVTMDEDHEEVTWMFRKGNTQVELIFVKNDKKWLMESYDEYSYDDIPLSCNHLQAFLDKMCELEVELEVKG